MITEFKYKEPAYQEGPFKHCPIYTPSIEIVAETCKEDFELNVQYDEYFKRDYLEEITLKDYTIQFISVKVNHNPWGEISFELKDGKFILTENGGNDEYSHGLTIEQVFCVFNIGKPINSDWLIESVGEALKDQIALEEGFQ